jgi:hypothetical protein
MSYTKQTHIPYIRCRQITRPSQSTNITLTVNIVITTVGWMQTARVLDVNIQEAVFLLVYVTRYITVNTVRFYLSGR